MRAAFATSPTDRISAVEEQFRLTDGRAMAFDLAFFAVQGNRLSLAREGLDAQDFDDPNVRDFRPLWTLDAFVHHLLGDYAAELDRARDGLARFSGRRDRVGDHPIGQAGQEIRALIGLDSIGSALRAYDRLAAWPVPRSTVWVMMNQAAMDFRRHGHPGASRHALGLLLDFVERHPDLDRSQVAQTYYNLGQYERAIPLLEAELDAAEGLARMRPAGMLIVSLEALERNEEASEHEWILSDFDRTTNDSNRRWAAVVAASRGDASETIRLLLEAYNAGVWHYHSGELDGLFMHLRPEFEAIREDPAFRRLMELG